MNEDLDDVIAYFRHRLIRLDVVTFQAIEEVLTADPFQLSEEEIDAVRRKLQNSFDIRQGRGSTVRSDYAPWLQARKSAIDFYYWNRLRNYLLASDVLPPNVISTLDNVSDEILDYCGNPYDTDSWNRRGMVIGHVQSGKTTNYTALICKAADAGYKIIILLAGLTNILRAQTQERLDETFIGKKSLFQPVAGGYLHILNFAEVNRFPAYGTSRDSDFKRAIAQNYGVTMAALAEPIIFITKKHKSTLGNLRDWIDDQNHGDRVSEPLLLIDDEADNASINTSADPNRSTAINMVIREILQLFDRSTYIGYTATPFANIFIDPVTHDEMLGDELFPQNFIKALDPPTNFVGAHRIFADDGDLQQVMVRTVDDHADSLPLVQSASRKSEFPAGDLPSSLYQAIRVFLLTRAIRFLRGDGSEHCTMMINVSRFNDVQAKIEGLVYTYLQKVKDAVAVNARATGPVTDPIIDIMRSDFATEFAEGRASVDEIMRALHGSISTVSVVTVNMRGGKLEYERNKENGLHVIAIGGLSLSRGLTLEGLTVSYIIRNASASDTLMQMARWFGYRPGYEDICRLYIPPESYDHYEQINVAIEELSAEIKMMDQLGSTPADFGLKVRQSPTGIRITAANKMRTATEMMIAQDYSGRHIEGHAVFNDQGTNSDHLDKLRSFFQRIGCPEPEPRRGGPFWRDIPSREVAGLIRAFSFPPVARDLTKISEQRSLVDDYISDRVGAELALWDVSVPGPSMGAGVTAQDIVPGRELRLRLRAKGKIEKNAFRINNTKNRVADPADARIDLSLEQEERALRDAESFGLRGDRRFCLVRERPLLIVHLLTLGDAPPPGTELEEPVATLSLCLPSTHVTPVERRYQVNQVFREAMVQQFADEADDDEETLAGGG